MQFVIASVFIILSLSPVASATVSNLYTIKTENIKLKNLLKQNVNLKNSRPLKKTKADIQKALSANGYFAASFKFSDNDIYILNPIKWDFFFEGNNFYSRHFLKKTLKGSSVSSNSEIIVPELEQSLTKLYKKAGFHFVKVSSVLKKSTDSLQSQLVFKIVENSVVKIKRIKFSGDFPGFSKSELKKKLQRYSDSQISIGVYSETALLSGLVSLKNDLNNLGYFNAYVGLEQLSFNKQKDKVSIGIKVFTNSPTKITSVSFPGHRDVSTFWLQEVLNVRKGEQLDLYKLEEGIKQIEDYYLQRGYLRVRVEENKNLSYSKDLKTVSISIPVIENEQTIVSSIDIKGNLKTKESIVLREILFKPGEVLTADKIKDSIERLTKLGFFSNIQIKPVFKKLGPKGTPINIILSERKSGSFTAGFGLSSELGLTAKTFAGFEYKNIRGTARAISGRAEIKRNLKNIKYWENRVFANYLEPYLFETDMKGRINLTRNDEIWDIDSANDEVTTIESNRLDLLLEKDLSLHTTLFISLFSLDRRGEKVYDNTVSDLVEKTNFKIDEKIASVGTSVQFDFRNNPFLPTKGSLSKIQVEYASPILGSNTQSKDLNNNERLDLEYFKIQGAYSFYKPVFKRWVLAQSFRGGYLNNYSERGLSTSSSDEVRPFPKSRAFFLGGATTIRGFDPSKSNERIPNDKYLEDNGGISTNGRTLGGGVLDIPNSSYFYLTKTELRFPLSKDSSWWGAIFYDGGSVQITDLNEDYEKWRHSVGLGFRFNTPVGPLLNLEIAYKLDRNTDPDIDESAIQFHLSVYSF